MSGLFQDEPPPPDDPPPPPPDGPGLFGDALPVALPAPEQAVAYRVLARKYRPTTFDDLIGQEAMVRTLRNAFAIGRVAHAFMLTGVRGVGKTTTARIIARALNCVGPDGTGGPTADPCGVCANCIGILADRHPDVIEMDAASRTGVDDVREIVEAVRFRPMQARNKVFILDEVHMLTTQRLQRAAEDAGRAAAACEVHLRHDGAAESADHRPVTLPALRPAPRAGGRTAPRISAASPKKESVDVEPGALEQIARAADGSVRDGLSILDQAIAQADGTDHRGPGLRHAGPGGPRGGVRPDGGGDGRQSPPPRWRSPTARIERGADLGVVLQDLLDLHAHADPAEIRPRPCGRARTCRRPNAPAARRSPTGCRCRAGPRLADAAEGRRRGRNRADRRAAAEMVLIRLCHVVRSADARRSGAATDVAARPARPRRQLPHPAVAAGRGRSPTAPPSWPPPNPCCGWPRLGTFRDIVALVGAQKEAMLHAHLLHSVHLVRFAPPVIELRPQPDAPRDLASNLAALLTEATGTRWTIAVSAAPGEPTLAEQGAAADTARRSAAADHPLVRAILETFPGARIDTVHDRTADAYGLPASLAAAVEPDIPPFAPPDAEYFDEDPMEIDP